MEKACPAWMRLLGVFRIAYFAPAGAEYRAEFTLAGTGFVLFGILPHSIANRWIRICLQTVETANGLHAGFVLPSIAELIQPD
jgi:hypothetical protein